MYYHSCLLILLLLIQAGGGVDAEALEYFRKAEALVGTPQEGSDEHARLLEEALAIEPEFPEARINLAIVYYQQGKLEQALEQVDLVVEQSPEQAAAHEIRGRILEDQGHLSEALGSLQKAVEVDPRDHRLKVLLGQFYHRLGDFEEASTAFRDALREGGASADLYYNLALSQRAAGNLSDAMENLRRAAGMAPADVRPHLMMAEIYQQQNEWDEALDVLLEAEQRKPEESEVVRQLGTVLLHLGYDEEARKRLERGTDDDPGVLANLGMVALEQGQPEKAAKYFRAALEKESSPLLWGYLGDALSQQDNLDEAEEAYRKALAEDEGDYSSLFNLAAILTRQDRLEEAREFYERAIAVRSDSGEAHLQLGILADRQEDSEAAVQYYRQALLLGLENGMIHYRLGFLLAAEGNGTEAIDHFSKAFERDAARFVPPVVEELRAVQSPLDSIRYTPEFNQLLEKYGAQLRGTAESPGENP